MKKILLFILPLTFLFTGVSVVHAEVVTDFDVHYVINQDGTVNVRETIVYDFEGEQRRGIFRDFSFTHPQPASSWYKNRSVKYAVEEVKKDGAVEPYTVTESDNQLSVRIGDENVYITGPHTYEISYTITGALSSGPQGAEFYWNVTGSHWPVLITQVNVTVDSSVEGAFRDKAACYVGASGSTQNCFAISRDTSSVSFESSTLLPGEQLTIATELNPAVINIVPNEEISYVLFGSILVLLWLSYLSLIVYRHVTKDKNYLPVIAQYEPYEGYSPLYTGVLMDGRCDSRDISAGILDLAEQGFLKIKRIESKTLWIFDTTDYEITLLRPLQDISNPHLNILSGLLFPSETVVGEMVLLSSLKDKQIANRKIILSLQKELMQLLKTNGIFTNSLPSWTSANQLALVSVMLGSAAYIYFASVYALIVVLIVGAVGTSLISLIAFASRRTVLGNEIKNHLQGFKLFLSVTDKERFEFHNAPEKSPELFMKYLPYAVALGVEEKWAEVFADITIPQPEWYDGGAVNTFSAAALTHDFSNFSTSFAMTSGASGSSGGGSAGGGGGGGGGGSW